MTDFIHLHVHSHYSILDGAATVQSLVGKAVQENMSALALTEHGNMFGTLDFYATAIKSGIKPIIGYEAYLAPRTIRDRDKKRYHLTILVKNMAGYRNLMKLASIAYLDGFYYKPRIDRELLKEYHEGLIALSGCLSSAISEEILNNNMDGARTWATELRDIFGEEDFYLELQKNYCDGQQEAYEGHLELSTELGIPVVATNDIHYIDRSDAEAHDAFLCIGYGKLVRDKDRHSFQTQEFYFRSGEEMEEMFSDIPEALENTGKIAHRCNLELNFGEQHMPNFDIGDETIANRDMLEEFCFEGLKKRYPDKPKEAVTRLEHELDVIEKMGFVNYFLIVHDFVKYAEDSGIPVGPGRGSAAGSIVSYTLGITKIDPLRYGLLFERFLNEGRNEPPDIDIDFCKDRREQVIEYVKRKYGKNNVCQIATFGTLAAKGVVRDVARVLDIEYDRADRIARLIPNGLGITLKKAVSMEPELREMVEHDKDVQKIFEIGSKLEGLIRNPGTHAAGVVISDKPITEYSPLFRSGDIISTQYDKKATEKAGLMKMDFLGLVTLTIIDTALRMIKKNRGEDVNIHEISLDTKGVYDLLGRGDTLGVFQLESSGMQDLVKKLKPDCFEDIIALVALYRPGPLGTGMVDRYIDCKHGKSKPDYIHPKLEDILKPTYGLFLYQEQIIQAAHEIAGFSLSKADTFRKAMGKKQPEIMVKYGNDFIEGCIKNDIPRETAERIYNNIKHFAEYGFNKSHSAAYGCIAYQTAYLKVMYPIEYRAALMTSEMSNTDKLEKYKEESEGSGIEVLPPDVNTSQRRFSVEADKVRFGLEGIKRVGAKAVSAILEARDREGSFTSIYNLCERVELSKVNKQVMESLIKSGAMDCIPGNRAQKLAALNDAMEHGASVQKEQATGQMSLFGDEETDFNVYLPDVPPLEESELLNFEKEVMGFYVSRHPLAKHRADIEKYATEQVADIKDKRSGKHVVIGGMIKSVKTFFTKTKNEKMGILEFEGLSGSCRVVCFPSVYKQYSRFIKEDSILFVEGKIDNVRDNNTVLADRLVTFEEAPLEFVRHVTISITTAGMDEDIIQQAYALFKKYRGDKPVFYRIETHDKNIITVECGREFRIKPVTGFCDEINELFGRNKLSLEVK